MAPAYRSFPPQEDLFHHNFFIIMARTAHRTGGKIGGEQNKRGSVVEKTPAKSTPSKKSPAKKSPASKTPSSSRRKSSTPVKKVPEVKRRYKPGERALKEIRAYQKSTEPLIRKLPFARLVRSLIIIRYNQIYSTILL